MRRVNIHGFQDIIKKKEAHKQLHTIIDFLFPQPRLFCQARLLELALREAA
jgi:hypothetical protein